MNGHVRVGVCLDTCHLLASGYDIVSAEGYAATFKAFDRLIGFGRLKLFHVNDSKKPLGSRVDRHTHIGEGCIGIDAFRRLVNDQRFQGLPMLLETPKERAKSGNRIEADKFDLRNLNTLRSLIRR
jgi:deoxyribonuclease-4